MRTPALLLTLSFSALLSHSLLGQAPTPPPPAKAPTPAKPTTAQPPPPPRQPAATRATMAVLVTDRQGKPIENVEVGVAGPMDRDGKTDLEGSASFRNMGGGTYRLRFEHPDFITLEREVSMQAGKALRTTAALNPAPSPPPKEEPAAAPTPATPQLPPPGSQPPTSLSIPDVFERNVIGKSPSKTTAVGCAGVATATLIQLRDPLAEHTHADADEAIYVIAGEGLQRIAGVDTPLTAGTLAMVPRGTAHTLTRNGSRPLVFVSILSGPPCTAK